jgi:hypothetical protein
MKPQKKVTNKRASEYDISIVFLSLPPQLVNPRKKMSQTIGILWSAGNLYLYSI